MKSGSNLPSIPWTERERAEFKRRIAALEAGGVGGASGEIQFNNAGSFGGAADVEIEGGQLRLPAIATPTAPAADGIKLFGRKYAETTIPFYLGNPDVEPTPLQAMIAEGAYFALLPSGDTTFTNFGCPAWSLTGSALSETPTIGTRRDRIRRVRVHVTTAATTAVAGVLCNTVHPLTVGGGNSWEGGFLGTMIAGPATGVTNASHRFFMGLHDTGAPSDVNPSTLLNMCGIGYDSADTEVQFMRNDGSGTATKTSLGASFPKPTADLTNMYRLRLFSPPGTGQVRYEVTNLVNRAVATGTVTTDLPTTSSLLTPKIYSSVGGVSAVTGVTIGPVQFQTEPY